MALCENDPHDPFPAAISAWKAMVVALYDEPLLDPRYADAKDSDLTPATGTPPRTPVRSGRRPARTATRPCARYVG